MIFITTGDGGDVGAAPYAPHAPIGLFREWIRTHLELQNLAWSSFSGFHVKRRASADGGPEAFTLPAGARIVDSAVQPLRVKTERIRNAQNDPLPVFQREQSLGSIAGVDRRIPAEAKRIELIYPRVIAGFGTSRLGVTLHLRQRFGEERPALRTMLAGGFRTA